MRDDADLHQPAYEGEYVIASEALYRILPDGSVEDVGATRTVLEIT